MLSKYTPYIWGTEQKWDHKRLEFEHFGIASVCQLLRLGRIKGLRRRLELLTDRVAGDLRMVCPRIGRVEQVRT